jgi:hypothetical protein
MKTKRFMALVGLVNMPHVADPDGDPISMVVTGIT